MMALLGVSVGAAATAYYFMNYHDPEDRLEKTTLKERIHNTVILPTFKAGSPNMDWVWNRSTENTKALLGLSVRVMATKDKVITKPDFDNEEEMEKETYEAVQHGILPGDKKIKAVLKWPVWRASLLLPWTDTGYQIEFWDLPKKKMTVSDNGIIMGKEFNPVLNNGLWRDQSVESQDKVMQRTFSDAHQDWAEAMQQLPEIYAQLNSRVAGQLNIMQRKSENIRKYKREQRDMDKKDAFEG